MDTNDLKITIDTNAPNPVANLRLGKSPHDNNNPTIVTLSWENPTNTDLKEVVITTRPAVPNSPFRVPKTSTNHAITFSKGSLTTNIYHFSVEAVDHSNNVSEMTNVSTEIVDLIYSSPEFIQGDYASHQLIPIPTLGNDTNIIIDADPVTPGNQLIASNLRTDFGSGQFIDVTNVTYSEADGFKFYTHSDRTYIYSVGTADQPNFFGLDNISVSVISSTSLVYTISTETLLQLLTTDTDTVVLPIQIGIGSTYSKIFKITVSRSTFFYSIDDEVNGDGKFEVLDGLQLSPKFPRSAGNYQSIRTLDFETHPRHLIKIHRHSNDQTSTRLNSYWVLFRVINYSGVND